MSAPAATGRRAPTRNAEASPRSWPGSSARPRCASCSRSPRLLPGGRPRRRAVLRPPAQAGRRVPNNCHCPLSTGGRQITMPMHRYKTQTESPEAKCPRFALIRCRMRSRALRKLQMHTIAPKGYRKGQVRSHLIVDVLCHPKSALKARARANGNGVGVGGQGDRFNPWGAGIVIRICATFDYPRFVAQSLGRVSHNCHASRC